MSIDANNFPSIKNSILKVIGNLAPFLILLIICLEFQSTKVNGMVIPQNHTNFSSSKLHEEKPHPTQKTQKNQRHSQRFANVFGIIPEADAAEIYKILDTKRLEKEAKESKSNTGLFYAEEEQEQGQNPEKPSKSQSDLLNSDVESIPDHDTHFQKIYPIHQTSPASSTPTTSRAQTMRDILTSLSKPDKNDIKSFKKNFKAKNSTKAPKNQTKKSHLPVVSVKSEKSGGELEKSLWNESKSEISSWEWTQIRRKRNGLHTFLTKPLRREKRALSTHSNSNLKTKWISDMCEHIPKLEQDPPLRCYDCSSTTADKDPQCDAKLFKYLRHSQKFNLGKRCEKDRGDLCMKTVKRKFGQRITERGCFKGPIRSPNGKIVESKDPCFTLSSDGYLTSTCFCSNNLCNAAPSLGPDGIGSLISVMILSCTFILYGLCFAFIETEFHL